MAAPENRVAISVTINKKYDADKNIDASNDLSKVTRIDRNNISLESLRKSIINAFDNSKAFKLLFNNTNYEWKIFSYDPNKADMEIEGDDDLEEDIDDFYPSDDDSEDDEGDNPQNDQYLKLRVVFFFTSNGGTYFVLLCDQHAHNTHPF